MGGHQANVTQLASLMSRLCQLLQSSSDLLLPFPSSTAAPRRDLWHNPPFVPAALLNLATSCSRESLSSIGEIFRAHRAYLQSTQPSRAGLPLSQRYLATPPLGEPPRGNLCRQRCPLTPCRRGGPGPRGLLSDEPQSWEAACAALQAERRGGFWEGIQTPSWDAPRQGCWEDVV